MVKIKADDSEIENILTALSDLVVEAGGFLHDELVMRAENGDLSIEIDRKVAQGEKIIFLPPEALLPMADVDVSVNDGKLVAKISDEAGYTPVQEKLLVQMVALFNASHKVEFQRRCSFWLSMQDYPDLLEKMMRGRTWMASHRKWYDAVKKGMDEFEIDDFIAINFVKSRVLGFRFDDSDDPKQVIMPLVDSLNHNWAGSRFANSGDKTSGILVRNRQPLKDTDQCFAFYSVMDGLDSYVKYDFVDEAAPLVRSVPMVINFKNIGTAHIQSRMDITHKKQLAKNMEDLRTFMPQAVRGKAKNIVSASHLLIPYEASPLALRRVLVFLLSHLVNNPLSDEHRKDVIRDAERQVIDNNIQFYDELLEVVAAEEAEKGKAETLDIVRSLAELQKKKLSQYELLPVSDSLEGAA